MDDLSELREFERAPKVRPPAAIENMNDLERSIYSAAFIHFLSGSHTTPPPLWPAEQRENLKETALTAHRFALSGVEWHREVCRP